MLASLLYLIWHSATVTLCLKANTPNVEKIKVYTDLQGSKKTWINAMMGGCGEEKAELRHVL